MKYVLILTFLLIISGCGKNTKVETLSSIPTINTKSSVPPIIITNPNNEIIIVINVHDRMEKARVKVYIDECQNSEYIEDCIKNKIKDENEE